MTSRVNYTKPDIKINQGAFLVYVGGIHVPASSVSVSFGIGSYPTAVVSLPADFLLKKLGSEDRLPVVMFFMDRWYEEPTLRTAKPTWRLLFDGEISQVAYSKSSQNRSVTFSCISHNIVLSYMSLVYLSGQGRDLLRYKSVLANEGQGVAQNTDLSMFSFFRKGAYGTGEIDRPMDFVKNLLLGLRIGGQPKDDAIDSIDALDSLYREGGETSLPRNSGQISAKDYDTLKKRPQDTSTSSDFFVRYNYRNRLDRRWIASELEDVAIYASGSQNTNIGKGSEVETGKPASETEPTKPKTISDTRFVEIMKSITLKGLQSQFTQGPSMQESFWNLIQKFYGVSMYSILQVPTAQFVYAGIKDDIPVSGFSSPQTEGRLANNISIPEMTFALPPACNVFTPAMVTGFSFNEDYSPQNTRTIVDSSFSTFFSSYAKEDTVGKQLYGYPEDQKKLLDEERITKKSADNILIFPEEHFRGPNVIRNKAPAYFLSLEQNSKFVRKGYKDKQKGVAKSKANGDVAQQITELDEATTVKVTEWRKEILYSYAKYLHLQGKYSARNGSIDLVFNPYVIPGLPFALIDSDENDQFHLTGLVTGVGINMSLGSAQTTVSYSYGRTLAETYEEVFAENTYGPDIGVIDQNRGTPEQVDIFATAPIMPVSSLANRLQVEVNARQFYQTLLHANESDITEDPRVRPYVFAFEDYFDSSNGQSIVDNNSTELPQAIKVKLTGGNLTKIYPGTISNVTTFSNKGEPFVSSFDLELKVKDTALTLINDYDLCMRRASRPICSLTEYSNFFNNSLQRSQLLTETETQNEFGVEYPVQLRTYVTPDDTNLALGSSYIRPVALEFAEGTQLPEMRRDWDVILLKYRNKIKQNTILGN